MGSRQLGERQLNFLARLYERGTGESVPITVSFQDGTLLIYLEENGNEAIVVPLDEWEVRVGGSAEDKIVLAARQTGDTIVCGDEHFLASIAEATDNADILKQISKAKRQNTTRAVRQSTGIIAVVIVVTMFGGCVTLAVLNETGRGHRHHRRSLDSYQRERETQDRESDSDAEQEVFDGAKYMQRITPIIKRAWRPPPHSKQTKVVVVFTVHKTGATSGARIEKSSGDPACDESGLKAISFVSPLPSPGQGAPDSFEIEFTFDLKNKKTSPPQQSSNNKSNEVKRYD